MELVSCGCPEVLELNADSIATSLPNDENWQWYCCIGDSGVEIISIAHKIE